MMDNRFDVSVVISTFNRADDLSDTLESLRAQESGGVRYEVIVVDNNSTDRTRDVIQSRIANGDSHLRYLFEGRQGVSCGRNAGIRAAHAPIIAFTDDDVLVAPTWIANIKRAFDANPDVDYLSGKMLPVYAADPPPWLTPSNSGPCTIRDRGDEPIYSKAGHFFPGWATVNLAFRRDMLSRVGPFAEDFFRGEDLELIVRVWGANGRGMYTPDVIVRHKVPAERMTKSYHRMWHTREGDIRSRVRYFEIFETDGRIRREVPDWATLFGVPPFVYRKLVTAGANWLAASVRRDEALAFYHECQVRQLGSYVRTRFKQNAAVRTQSPLRDLASFAKALLFRKWTSKSRTT